MGVLPRRLILFGLFCVVSALAGCNGAAPGPDAPAPSAAAIRRVDVVSLPPVEEYLGVALDGGRVRIAPPSQWERAPRSAKYLAAFLRTRKSQVPRITVNGSDSPYSGFERVTESNVLDFNAEVTRHLQQSGVNVAEAPLAMIIGSNAFSRYVLRQGQVGGVPLQRQMLVTVFDNRLYEVDLAVFENRILESRDFAYAVAGALQFQQPEPGSPSDPTDLPQLDVNEEAAQVPDAE